MVKTTSMIDILPAQHLMGVRKIWEGWELWTTITRLFHFRFEATDLREQNDLRRDLTPEAHLRDYNHI